MPMYIYLATSVSFAIGILIGWWWWGRKVSRVESKLQETVWELEDARLYSDRAERKLSELRHKFGVRIDTS